MDLLIINPGAVHGIYGPLGDTLVAVEPPLWCRLIAGYVRARGCDVRIHDMEAHRTSPAAVARLVQLSSPTLVCVAVYGHQPSASTQQMVGAGAVCKAIKKLLPSQPIVMVGGHPSALPEYTLQTEAVDYVCAGEGPATVLGLLDTDNNEAIPGLVWRRGTTIVKNPPAPLIEDLGELHGEAWDLLPMHLYRPHNWQCFGDMARRDQPYASIYTSLSCPYRCLEGNVKVNTIYGNIPIKTLAECFGDAGVPIYTYDPASGRAFIADGVKIRKYGNKEQLVRVHFDDGSHIDCTPDHRFLQFKWSNGRSNSSEWECEAQHLAPGSHVRALRTEQHLLGRYYISWSRMGRAFRSRMVAEYLLGRRLRRTEPVHHLDHDISNDHPSNLQICGSAKEHFRLHPEISARMRSDNPTKNGMSAKWRESIVRANRGKVRSPEARMRYRLSKLGKKNPNYRHGRRTGGSSRLEVNHRVAYVEPLAERGDVYCLTVPETGWFYANNVLVKNCNFCCIAAPFLGSNRYRMRSPVAVVDEIVRLYWQHKVRTFKIVDEMFVLNEKHYTAICNGLIASGIASELNIWAYARVDTVKPNTLAMFRKAGFRWLALGIESGSKHVRDGADKAFRNDDIIGVVRAIQGAGINVIGNYIFGLPDDTLATMQETLTLAVAAQTEFANFYCAMAYPGSRLYTDAVGSGRVDLLPKTWAGYSQHNAECTPLATETLSAAEVLAFRDAAFTAYFQQEGYRITIRRRFGQETLDHVDKMTTYRLPRKLLQNAV